AAVDEPAGEFLAQSHRRVGVLDRGDPAVLEHDVGDPRGGAAGARVGVDAEGLGGGVGGLADDVRGTHVADDRVLDPVAVDHGRHGAAAHAVFPVVPDGAGGGHHDVRQGLGVQRAAVGLGEGGGGGERGIGAGVAAGAGPAVAVDVQVGLPVHDVRGAAHGDRRRRAVVGAVEAAGDLGAV